MSAASWSSCTPNTLASHPKRGADTSEIAVRVGNKENHRQLVKFTVPPQALIGPWSARLIGEKADCEGIRDVDEKSRYQWQDDEGHRCRAV